jgi:hypothetical protein
MRDLLLDMLEDRMRRSREWYRKGQEDQDKSKGGFRTRICTPG